MGLDISHDCWHGAYSAFGRWRREIAYIAGYPPLDLMEGFYNRNYWLSSFNDRTRFREWAGTIDRSLPIKWEKWKDDPLAVLLYHSDSSGNIKHEFLLPLANRLEGLLGSLPTTPDDGHIGDWGEKTKLFIKGLRLAHSRGEDIEFR